MTFHCFLRVPGGFSKLTLELRFVSTVRAKLEIAQKKAPARLLCQEPPPRVLQQVSHPQAGTGGQLVRPK